MVLCQAAQPTRAIVRVIISASLVDLWSSFFSPRLFVRAICELMNIHLFIAFFRAKFDW